MKGVSARCETAQFKKDLEDALADRAAPGWFEPRAVRRLWREHLEGRYDHRKALWSFLVSIPFQGGS